MWRRGQIIFREMTKKQMLVENRICSHCLSTTIPPSRNQSTATNTNSKPTVIRSSQGNWILGSSTNLIFTRYKSDFVKTSAPGLNLHELQNPKTQLYARNQQTDASSVITEADIKEVPVPDYQEDNIDELFRGLETDFPCLSKNKVKGPEPAYDSTTGGYDVYHHQEPFRLRYRRGVLPELHIAYESWGELNEAKDNAVLLQCGLSASSHAKSHKNNLNPGWWEKFIGPGCALDTDKFFVICTNTLGGCYGTTGPSSINPLSGEPYATKFPILSVEDIVRAQFLLLDHFGVDTLHSAVGSSLGGMQSITSAVLYPDRVNRIVSISSCARSHPSSIALRYIQRKAIMTDPDWQRGYYYNSGRYPKMGMKIAREIATLTYRSGPEWDERFGRKRIDDTEEPSLCPYFMIENYLDYQGESFVNKLDPNTLLYISKAMDLFDLGETFGTLHSALGRVNCPVMIIGVQTDILFPIWQQRELAQVLQEAGNDAVTYYELNSLYGHDTFLLDLNGVGAGVKGFLETEMVEKGMVRKGNTTHNKDRSYY